MNKALLINTTDFIFKFPFKIVIENLDITKYLYIYLYNAKKLKEKKKT